MSRSYEKLQPYLERAQAFQTAKILFQWDNETLAPRAAGPNTSRVVGTLSSEYFSVITDPEVERLAKECGKEDLSPVESAIVRELTEEIGKLRCVPPKEYREFAELVSEGTRIWADARREKDFEKFAPTLKNWWSTRRNLPPIGLGKARNSMTCCWKTTRRDLTWRPWIRFSAS